MGVDKIIASIIGITLAAIFFLGMTWVFHLNVQLGESQIGNEVQINNKVLLILDYSKLFDCYYLSNGAQANSEYINELLGVSIHNEEK